MQALLASENLFFELPLLLAITLTLIQLIGGLEAGHAPFQSLSREILFCHTPGTPVAPSLFPVSIALSR